MNPRDIFLREHTSVHTRAVEPAEFNMDHLVEGLTEHQMRVRPHGLNSLAWIFWHISRVEDGYVSYVVLGRDQLLDQDNWISRLQVSTRDVSTPKVAVGELSDSIDLDALWAYRNAVGRRTREGVATLSPDKWDDPIDVSDIRRAVAAGICKADMEQFLTGKSRESALHWWGLHHTLMHLGQVSMLRSVVRAL